MDPISLIIAAIAAGAIVGVKDTTGQAVKDAYTSLKALLRHRFAENREAEAALDQAEQHPESGQGLLVQHLNAAGAGGDEELIRAAQAVLVQADPAGARTGKYKVQIIGGKGIVVGDAANVTMTFNDRD
jgi:hypothetical protein